MSVNLFRDKHKVIVKYPLKRYQISYKRNFKSSASTINTKATKKSITKRRSFLRFLNAIYCAPTRYRFVHGNRLSEFGLRVSDSTRAAFVDTVRKTSAIRFDTPHVGHHTYPHINIDIKGTKLIDPHWKLPNGALSAAEGASKAVRYVGRGLLIAGVLYDSARIAMALRDDYKKYKKEKTKLPTKTIKTVSSVGGGWAGGTAGAMGGSYAGASIGASIGSIFGGVGAIPGAVVGSIIGAISGGIGGGIGGSVAAESIAENFLDNDDNWEDMVDDNIDSINKISVTRSKF